MLRSVRRKPDAIAIFNPAFRCADGQKGSGKRFAFAIVWIIPPAEGEPVTTLRVDTRRASLLAELVAVTGREDMPALMQGETIETIGAELASRRQAQADIRRYGRLGAVWANDQAAVEGLAFHTS